MLAPFQVRAFRFQWPADLASSLASEMETIALGWFVLVETGSVLLLTLFGSMQYLGTLMAPVFGLVGDRIGHGRLLSLMRGAYLLFALLLGALAATDTLVPAAAIVIAGAAGLVRCSDMSMRNVLISEVMPADRLLAALGLSRITADSSRGLGALTGAALVAALGIGGAYGAIATLYAASFLLTAAVGLRGTGARDGRPARPVAVPHASPWHDMRAGFTAVWSLPPQLAAISLAFLINLAPYPFILGLLPYVAREVYRADQAALGYLVAAASVGSVVASLLVSRFERHVLPGRTIFLAAMAWSAVTILLGRTGSLGAGIAVLLLAGLAQGLCIVPMAALQLRNAPPELRGRIAGLRTLAVYGLPLGLWIAGPLIDRFGFTSVATLYGSFGLACTLAMLLRWRRHLWPADAPANRRE